MNKDELTALRQWLAKEIEKRKGLGGYSQEADAILNLFEVAYKLACHVRPEYRKE